MHTKFVQILSIHSQYIKRKLYSDINLGLFVKILNKMTGNNAKLDHVNVDEPIKFGQILSISRDIERKRNFDIKQGP